MYIIYESCLKISDVPQDFTLTFEQKNREKEKKKNPQNLENIFAKGSSLMENITYLCCFQFMCSGSVLKCTVLVQWDFFFIT